MEFATRKVLLAKMKLPDHAQLLVKFLSKKIFKNFENFRKIFSFFSDGKFFGIFRIFENFRKIPLTKSMFFEIFKISDFFEIFENFRNFQIFQIFSEIF